MNSSSVTLSASGVAAVPDHPESSAPRRRGSALSWRSSKRWIVIVPGVIFAIFPVYWMLTSALKATPELYAVRPTLYPHALSLEQFRDALGDGTLLAATMNSAVVAVSAALVVVVFGSAAAYAVTQWAFPGVQGVQGLTLFTQLLPAAATVVPIYLLWAKLGWIGNLGGLGMLYSIISMPVAVWMLIGFFRSIPYELTEAGLVDGASRIRILWSIILPIARPSLVAVGIYVLISCWGEFFFALVFLGQDSRTTTVALSATIGEHNTNIGPLMAASAVSTLVPLVIFFALQRQFVSGLTSGAVKA